MADEFISTKMLADQLERVMRKGGEIVDMRNQNRAVAADRKEKLLDKHVAALAELLTGFRQRRGKDADLGDEPEVLGEAAEPMIEPKWETNGEVKP